MPKKSIHIIEETDSAEGRVRWAINYVAKTHGMSNKSIAKLLGCATSTINSYRRKVTYPGLDFFTLFLYKYSFSLQWFTKREGEPFPGARDIFPGVCGPEPKEEVSIPVVLEELVGYRTSRSGETHLISPDIKISHDLRLATEVLESNTPYATALHLNIHSFSRAITAESRIAQVTAGQVRIREEMTDLKIKFEALQKENDGLKSRLNGLEGGLKPAPDTEEKAM